MNVYIDELVSEIFKDPPKGENEIQLSLIGEYTDIKGLFEFLIDFFTRGCKLLFGNNDGKVDLNLATDAEFKLMKKYFKSFSIDLIIDKYDEQDMLVIDFNKMKYTNKEINDDTKLSELALPLKCGNNVYVIKFDTTL